MKKRILAMVSVLILMLTIPAYAVQSRAPAVLPSLSFSGTKATCEVLVTADNYMDDIYLEIELWRGSVKIEDWTVSGEGFIDFSKTASVAKGNTYTLKVYAEINNVEITPVSLTKTYRYERKCDLHMQVTRGIPRVTNGCSVT